MLAAPSFLRDVDNVNWGSVSDVSVQASEAMMEVQQKFQLSDADTISTASLPVSSVRDAVVMLQNPGSGSGRELTNDEIKELLADLVAAYSDPAVQKKCLEIQAAARERLQNGSTHEDWMGDMRHYLFPLQTDIAESYGMPGTTESLQRIQNAVQRKITEGDIEIRFLADEVLMLLGMNPLQNIIQECRAEDFLNVIYEAAGDASPIEVDKFFANLSCSTVLEKTAKARGLAAARRLIEERRPQGGLTFGLLRTWAAYERVGLPPHQLVHHEETPSVARLKRPTPAEIWPYVLRNEPVIIEGAMDGDSFPPFFDFQDFDYLRERAGHRYVKVKGDSCWDEQGRQLFMNDPTIEISVSDFLDLVEIAEEHETCISWYMGKLPLHKEIPELFEDIQNSAETPYKKYGCIFGDNSKGVHTYFGCGGNTTCLHCDPSENLMACVMGEKWLDLYPPWEADCMHTTVKKFLNSLIPPFCDPTKLPESVKQNWPNHSKAKPVHVHLKAGEMLYLPIFWWHAVQGSIGRNMILNWWCSQHPHKAHIYNDLEGEGVREILEVMQHLQQAWDSSDQCCATPSERIVVKELSAAAGVHYSETSSSANGYRKLAPQVLQAQPPAQTLLPQSRPKNGFRWKTGQH
eukprot:TRINITY_DN19088_c0_g4_i1.p1 TRINITY_DN19088_c0_g4~~TRINITY_DN19088_c0_g4_i1.p1  ORF type:complete len:632 (-),score=116.58 TRINITY_DN19088_c0_g4_i1:81-1976(-)